MKRKCRLLIVFMVMVVLITAAVYKRNAGFDIYEAEKVQKHLADNIIRFHIRAAGNSEYDQNMKLYVKEKAVTYMTGLLEGSKDKEESKRIIEENTDIIRDVAKNAVAEYIEAKGVDVDEAEYNNISVYFEYSYFPMKVYDDIIFPQGEYEAFRIDIGDAAGRNWWCVLYPPLCFVDSVHASSTEESKDNLKKFLTDEEYSAITNQYEFRFRILTFLNDLFQEGI